MIDVAYEYPAVLNLSGAKSLGQVRSEAAHDGLVPQPDSRSSVGAECKLPMDVRLSVDRLMSTIRQNLNPADALAT